MKLNLDDRIVGDLQRLDALLPASGPRGAGGPAAVEEPAHTTDPATEALAAITSRYEDARSGILTGDTCPSDGPQSGGPAPERRFPAPAPTVPLTLRSSLEKAERQQHFPTGARHDGRDEPHDPTTFWARLAGRLGSAAAGRHSPGA